MVTRGSIYLLCEHYARDETQPGLCHTLRVTTHVDASGASLPAGFNARPASRAHHLKRARVKTMSTARPNTPASCRTTKLRYSALLVIGLVGGSVHTYFVVTSISLQTTLTTPRWSGCAKARVNRSHLFVKSMARHCKRRCTSHTQLVPLSPCRVWRAGGLAKARCREEILRCGIWFARSRGLGPRDDEFRRCFVRFVQHRVPASHFRNDTSHVRRSALVTGRWSV